MTTEEFGMTSPLCHLDHRERSLFSSFPQLRTHCSGRCTHIPSFPLTLHRHHDEIPLCVRDDSGGQFGMTGGGGAIRDDSKEAIRDEKEGASIDRGNIFDDRASARIDTHFSPLNT
ncbi:hypothetical protein Cpha266_2296 [Chlorobium phaeobacteroides DSM 266]|uniref:Uncharacterized protein n=1 Tax=Chlorobium phaeobacteroides (strain DSM 266 / SMG 266 / 2430) TaxID=290317 RepID=A1BIR1_CHLPD|nr:hypothetical protein Cpha266_2296 [Chlorobium phaeobacteroides DSM 266]